MYWSVMVGQVAPEEMAALLVDMAEMVGMGDMVVMTAMEPETAVITGMVMDPETIMAEKGMGADYE